MRSLRGEKQFLQEELAGDGVSRGLAATPLRSPSGIAFRDPAARIAREDATGRERPLQDLRAVGIRSADSDSRNEKGGVVRRPFSKLLAWLIAVRSQPGVVTAIGIYGLGLSLCPLPFEDGDEAAVLSSTSCGASRRRS